MPYISSLYENSFVYSNKGDRESEKKVHITAFYCKTANEYIHEYRLDTFNIMI